MNAPLVEITGLRITIPTDDGPVDLVDGVDLRIEHGEVVGVAGESGSGKTLTALALMGFLPNRARVTSGVVSYDGKSVFDLSAKALRAMRGKEIGMIFQDPMTSLHPMLSIERLMTEHMRVHLKLSTSEARERALGLLDEVRLPDPERVMVSFAHQFSGGMRQRIAIAIALACEPRLLIADEPTTALDVTVQAGILHLLDRLRKDSGLSVLFISHDLGVVNAIADRLNIFYAGRVVERGSAAQLLKAPRHPYTRSLLDSLPGGDGARSRLRLIPGETPAPGNRPSGCAFHPRCQWAEPACSGALPELLHVEDDRAVACPVDPFGPDSPSVRSRVPGGC